jgi:hypothetical protein
MRRSLLAAVALLAACKPKPEPHPPAGSAEIARMFPLGRDSTDSVLNAPRLVADPSVVVFWLRASDTIPEDDRTGAFDDLRYYTEQVLPALDANDIDLVATRAETLFVKLPNGQRRVVVLSGLDFPYGYVLVDPGGPERILTGVYSDDELLDELRAYFDLPDDSTDTEPPPTT